MTNASSFDASTLISIIIPTYNEQEDIEETLDYLVALNHKNLDVIIVDDGSTDKTVEILQRYVQEHGFRVIQESKRRGPAFVRNLGASKVRGDIVVFLNADAHLHPSYCEEILAHYREGADFVVADSRVKNTEHPIPAYVQGLSRLILADQIQHTWSEGWSIRREVWEAEDGFPLFPHPSGEDVAFTDRLDKKYKCVHDLDLHVFHIQGTGLKGFLKDRKGRGRGAAFYYCWFESKRPWRFLTLFSLEIFLGLAALGAVSWQFGSAWAGILVALVFISCHFGWRTYKLTRDLDKKFYVACFFLDILNWLYFKIGYWQGCVYIIKNKPDFSPESSGEK